MRFTRAGLAVVALTAPVTCTRYPTQALPSVTDFIAQVALASDPAVRASLLTGEPPNLAGTSGTLGLTGPARVINGGSAAVGVDAGTAAFQIVIVAVRNRPDYYVLSLPAGQTRADLIVTLATDPPGSFQWVYGVGTSLPGAGNYTAQSVALVRVLSGDVQVSVAWDADSDVNLHVIEPGGAEIYPASRSSGSGGVLDLDSNAACAIGGIRNENVTWPDRSPPPGTYVVRLDYWAACGVAQTSYVVTIRVRGRNPQTFAGAFSGPGDAGGAGSGVTIAAFDVP